MLFVYQQAWIKGPLDPFHAYNPPVFSNEIIIVPIKFRVERKKGKERERAIGHTALFFLLLNL